jgi:hypothetical protein
MSAPLTREPGTTRGSSGPCPLAPVNQTIARELTMKILFQSTEGLSTREVAGRFFQPSALPSVVYDKNKQPVRNFSQENASNFENFLLLTLVGQIRSAKPHSFWTIY